MCGFKLQINTNAPQECSLGTQVMGHKANAIRPMPHTAITCGDRAIPRMPMRLEVEAAYLVMMCLCLYLSLDACVFG